ncbi:MAG: protein kinase [Acidobacteriota bacterium]
MLQCPRCSRQYPDDVHVCPHDFTPLRADETIADVPLDPLIDRVFEGKYRLDERLGGGGMGTVYRATHLLIERPVAVKVLSQRFVGDETAQQRFRREARAAGRMQHPNAVMVNDFGATSDGYLYIVMELLEGLTLRDLLAREGPLDPARAVSIMLQASAAVGAAHDAKLIHRDLKPANIFIEQRANMASVVKVLDFGVAKFIVEEHDDDDFNTLTQVGAVIGTPRYMSPEQCSGIAHLTPASDVYSLGIILYEMLSGAVPFIADTPLALALKHVSEAPRNLRETAPGVPDDLERVVTHALTKNPTDRPADANEFRTELHETAERLGLEHSDSTLAPSLEALRHAGTESPSGRLVIDLATLRQVQAATSGDSLRLPTSVKEAAQTNPTRPIFDRLNISILKQAPGDVSVRARVAVAVMIVLIVLVTGAAVVSRWWNSGATAGTSNAANANTAAAAASPSPSPSPAPSPSPSPVARPNKTPDRKKPEKPSRIKKLVNRVKGIFKRN